MAPRFKNILVKFIYLGGVTSANIISGLDPQELDRPLLSAKTACPKLDALANAASFAINSSIGGWLLAADGLGVRVCRAGGSAAHTALGVFSRSMELCAPFGRHRLPKKNFFGPIQIAQRTAEVSGPQSKFLSNVTPQDRHVPAPLPACH